MTEGRHVAERCASRVGLKGDEDLGRCNCASLGVWLADLLTVRNQLCVSETANGQYCKGLIVMGADVLGLRLTDFGRFIVRSPHE